MKTVFVLVDALKSLYLTEENMPFLYSLSQKGHYVQQIIPCAGYCERSEVFSGLDGYETGNFTAIGYLPENSPYKKYGLILNIAECLEKINYRVARKLFSIWRKKKQRRLNPYRIPFKSLGFFALTEDGNEQLIPHREIFDVLNEAGLSYTLGGFTALSDFGKRTKLTPVEFAKSEIDKQTDFVPVYIGVIDGVGHQYGRDIDSIRPYLQEMDDQLKEIYDYATGAGYAFSVLGDHGMVPVDKKINLMGEIGKLGYKLHKDYEVFYDSTLTRFWFRNKDFEQVMYNLFEDRYAEDGFIVNKDNCEKYRIPLQLTSKDGTPVYGDMVWCAHPGVLISPDYFHAAEASENGMHGYIEFVEGHGTGLFVSLHKGIESDFVEKASSSTVCGELCKLLELKMPNQ